MTGSAITVMKAPMLTNATVLWWQIKHKDV